MLKKAVNLFLLPLPFLLNACNKDSDSSKQPSQFEMTGVHDVVADGSGRNSMLVSINQTSGTPEPVDIDIFSLPAPYAPVITTKTGTPNFSTGVFFFEGGPPAVYHIIVTASSPHCYRADSMFVIVPGNDFAINGTHNALLNDTMSVGITYVSGAREKVAVDAGGLPEGVGQYSTPNPCTPDSTSKIVFFRINAPSVAQPGTYPIKIYGHNSLSRTMRA